jgi:hypothetical protein
VSTDRWPGPAVHGLLVITGWHGSTSYRVAVVGMTPKRFRIRALQPLRLPRRGRTLQVGDEALVPKTAVRITEAGPVWHLTRTPGRPWCASDYPNLAQTDIEANANCPACAEAKKQPAPTKNNHVA